VFWGRQGVQLLREGRWIPADAAALRAGGPGLAGIQMARAGLPLPALEGLEGLSVADTPGIGTPQAARGGALLALARRAGAYILVFGADAPVVTESLAAFLSCLPLDSRPVLCVLTKCDQFPRRTCGRSPPIWRKAWPASWACMHSCIRRRAMKPTAP